MANDTKNYDDLKIKELFTYIKNQKGDFKTKTGKSMSQFQDFSEKRFFSKETTGDCNNFEFSINVNNEKIQKSNDLNQCESASVTRSNQDISISEDTYHYTVGAYSSIRSGSKYAYMHSPKTTKMSTYKGKKISMYIGNTKSVNHITNNKSFVRNEFYNIKDFSGQVESFSKGVLHLSETILVKEFVKTSSQIAVDAHYYIFRADITLNPMKGHFTAFQQIFSGLYGDFVKYENLFRIFATTHTFSDKNATRMYDAAQVTFVDRANESLRSNVVRREHQTDINQNIDLLQEGAVAVRESHNLASSNRGAHFSSDSRLIHEE